MDRTPVTTISPLRKKRGFYSALAADPNRRRGPSMRPDSEVARTPCHDHLAAPQKAWFLFRFRPRLKAAVAGSIHGPWLRGGVATPSRPSHLSKFDQLSFNGNWWFVHLSLKVKDFRLSIIKKYLLAIQAANLGHPPSHANQRKGFVKKK